jgi:hypothetical protein
MAMSLSIEKAKVSKLKRLKMLPRIGFTIDVAGYQLSYRNVPITETIINLFDTGFSMKNLMKVSALQCREVELEKLKAPRLK